MKVRCGSCSGMVDSPPEWSGGPFACPECGEEVTLPQLPGRSRQEMLEDRKKRRRGGVSKAATLVAFGFFGIIVVIGLPAAIEGYNYWVLAVGVIGMLGALFTNEKGRKSARKQNAGDVLQGTAKPAILAPDSPRDLLNEAVPAVELSRRQRAVLEELEKLASPKRGLLRKVMVLIVTLGVFMWLGMGFFSDSLTGMIVLVAVILFHELGHYAAMRLLGYRDVSIFFIPMLGAATSGRELGAAGWKKATVTLMGPVPGLLIGLALGVVYLVTRGKLLGEIAVILVGLNALNLLPVLPLDGGRLFYEILFCRNRYLDFAVKILSAILLGMVALVPGMWFLGVFAFLLLVGAPAFLREEGIVARLKSELALNRDAIPDIPPPPVACRILAAVEASDRSMTKVKPKILAGKVDGIWRRLHSRPPGLAGTIGFLAAYGFCVLLAMMAPVVAAVASSGSEVVEYRCIDGSVGYREVVRFGGSTISEMEVSADGLYHGKATSYHPFSSKVSKRGKWSRGKWHGEWQSFDLEGRPAAITVFDKGRFVLRKEKVSGRWIEKSLTQLTGLERSAFELHEKARPEGPDDWHKRVALPREPPSRDDP